jgi:hypothetical protein
MPPAVAAAGIVAAGTIGGAVLGSKAQKKAANQANAAQQDATQAQLQLGRESMALNRDIYNSNYSLLSPFVSRGNVAGNSINALLGLPSAPAMASPLAGGGSVGGSTTATQTPIDEWSRIQGMLTDNIDNNFDPAALSYIRANQGRIPANYDGPTLDQISRFRTDSIPGNYEAALARLGGVIASNPVQHNPVASQTPAGGTTTATGAAATPSTTPQQAFQNFANSAGMQFQLQRGGDMINNNYAARGQLQSGAAMRSLQDYGQQTALNNYFLPYMGLLSGQQAVGAQTGAAVAGVGSNFGNTAAGINSQMGSAIQGGADAAGNAALLRGQANSNMWGSIGGALGGLASSFVPTGGRY